MGHEVFYEKKCKVIHFGRENPGFDYHMNNITLPVTHDETDVGVVIQNTLKPSKHCAQIARKANAILGTIARSFHFKDRFTNLIFQLSVSKYIVHMYSALS